MKVQNGTCSDVRVAYIGGGSHGWAWTFFKDLAREEKMSGILRQRFKVGGLPAEKNCLLHGLSPDIWR